MEGNYLFKKTWKRVSQLLLNNTPRNKKADPSKQRSGVPVKDFGNLLKERCEIPMLYLDKDFCMDKLVKELYTNRTYLSSYFSLNGTSYPKYINKLRIRYFVSQYKQHAGHKIRVEDLIGKCGFRTYSAFYVQFRTFMGCGVSEWIKSGCPDDVHSE